MSIVCTWEVVMASFRFAFKRRAVAMVVVVLSWSASQVGAQSPGRLALHEALGLAQSNAPALNAATIGARAAREQAVAAGQLPDPILRFGVENLPANGPDAWKVGNDFMTMRRIGVMQEYVTTDKRDLLRRRVELEAVRQEATRSRLTANLRQEVAVAWFERYYAGKSRELLKTLEAEVELQLRTLDSQIRAGKAGVGDASLATAALLQLRDRLMVADKQERVAQIALGRWLGKDAAREPEAAPDVDSLALDLANPGLLDAAPALREHESESEFSRADLAVAQSNKRANWSWEVAYSQRGPAYSNMVSFGVSIPLTFNASNKQDREVAARQAQLEQAHVLHEDMRRETEAALAAAHAEWKSLVDRRKRLAAALLPVAGQRVELALGAYRAGSGSLPAVLEARRAEVEARMQLLDLERETARLWAQLNFAYVEPAMARAKGTQP
ncbi:MAG: TolC family protein [Burkholderiales bacterium]|nr:TolC family protein [Burkholderiales bacterium]